MVVSNMRLTTRLGTDFWNDSCDPDELGEAVAEGAVGATSNPVIVYQAVQSARERWIPVLDRLITENPSASEDEIAWMLITEVAATAAAILRPVYDETQRRKGYLSVQVNPKYFRNPGRMVQHARELAAIAPNIAIKIPATESGVAAIEQLTAEGIRINATVCFSVAQAIVCAEAVERGVQRAESAGRDTSTLLPNITIMVGRIDDHLRRVMERDDITIDPGHLNWAGVAVFKKAWQLFRTGPYRSTLLAAAYRYHMHWTALIGERVAQTVPYKWWKQFNIATVAPRVTIAQPLAEERVRLLYDHFADFRRAYDQDGLRPADFERYGASVHTLNQFLSGYHKLLELVRERMLAA
jgi:transaldolase